jgi:UDP-glucose 4-epimerase
VEALLNDDLALVAESRFPKERIMRVLVTGGAGFIGSHVVDAYVGQGHDVLVVDDLSTGKRENVHPRARLYPLDIRDKRLREIFASEQPDIVNHHAARANVRESMEKPSLYADVNILGSLHLLELSREYSVKKFIFISTGGAVYGEPEYLPADEAHPISPLDPYGASKAGFEHYLPLYQTNYGISFTVLRYANVYGPRQDPHGEAGVVAIFAGRMLRAEQAVINGGGEQERDFVYAGDVARANLLALDKGDSGTYNIGTGIGTSINDIFSTLKLATGYEKQAAHGPPKAGEVFKVYLATARAERELSWQPLVPLEEGLRLTVDYFRSQG